jgi:hypothetical protein
MSIRRLLLRHVNYLVVEEAEKFQEKLHERPQEKRPEQLRLTRERRPVICYKCQKPGHIAHYCRTNVETKREYVGETRPMLTVTRMQGGSSNGSKPDISNLVPFYSPGVVYLSAEERDNQFSPKGLACRMIGYVLESKNGYIVYIPETMTKKRTVNCKFKESIDISLRIEEDAERDFMSDNPYKNS